MAEPVAAKNSCGGAIGASSLSLPNIFREREKFNILYPGEGILEVSPLRKVLPRIVKIDPDPPNGEVFKVKVSRDRHGRIVDEYALNTIALEKLALAAGVVFDPVYTRRLDRDFDPRRVVFQVTGALQKPDGTWLTATHAKEVNLDAIEHEERIALEEESRRGRLLLLDGGRERPCRSGTLETQAEINRRLALKMTQWERDKVAIAETGARNRVIRSLLGVRPSYRKHEINKPFVVFCLYVNTEALLADAELKKEVVRWSLNLMTPSLGGWSTNRQTRIDDLSVLPASPDISLVELGPQGLSQYGRQLESSATGRLGRDVDLPSAPTDKTAHKARWLTQTAEGRLAEIKRLIAVTHYAPKLKSKPPEDLSEQEQVDYLWVLHNLACRAAEESRTAEDGFVCGSEKRNVNE